MTYILLIRHGENDYTKTGRLAGWIAGVGLNKTGKVQAKRLVERLDKAPIAAIYSSPLQRCRETAGPLAKAKGLKVQALAGVAEVRYGKWQGKRLSKLRRHKLWPVVQNRPSAMVFPEGEAMRDVQIRAVNAIEAISQAHPQEMVAVFSHSDVIKMIVAHYLGTPLDLFQRIGISTASVSGLYVNQGTPYVLGVNNTTGVFPAMPMPSKKAQKTRKIKKKVKKAKTKAKKK